MNVEMRNELVIIFLGSNIAIEHLAVLVDFVYRLIGASLTLPPHQSATPALLVPLCLVFSRWLSELKISVLRAGTESLKDYSAAKGLTKGVGLENRNCSGKNDSLVAPQIHQQRGSHLLTPAQGPDTMEGSETMLKPLFPDALYGRSWAFSLKAGGTGYLKITPLKGSLNEIKKTAHKA